jgi:hypothetical protein
MLTQDPDASLSASIQKADARRKAIIKRHFKPLQDNFSLHLVPALNASGQGLFGTSLYDVMEEAQAVLEAALNDMRREPTMGRS